MNYPKLYQVSESLHELVRYFGNLAYTDMYRYKLMCDSEEEVALNLAAKLEPKCNREVESVLLVLKTTKKYIDILIETLEREVGGVDNG